MHVLNHMTIPYDKTNNLYILFIYLFIFSHTKCNPNIFFSDAITATELNMPGTDSNVCNVQLRDQRLRS